MYLNLVSETINSFILIDVCLIEFIGMTLVNKFMLASGVQFYNMSSVYCTMCSPPQVKSLSINIFLILPWSTSPPPPFPSGTHRTVVCLLGFVVVVNSFTFFTQHPNPLPCFKAVCSLCLYMSLFLFCLLVYFVHQILHTSEIKCYLSSSDWLISHVSKQLSSINQQTSVCKDVQEREPLCLLVWKAIWSYLKKLKMKLLYEPAIPPLVIHLEKTETLIQMNICTPMLIAALLTIATFASSPSSLS